MKPECWVCWQGWVDLNVLGVSYDHWRDDAQKLRKEGRVCGRLEFVQTSGARCPANIISPPWWFWRCSVSVTERSPNSIPNTEARVTNVAGFGWQSNSSPNPSQKMIRKKYEKDFKGRDDEKSSLRCATLRRSFSDLRYRQMYDKHTTGSGYLELIHNEQGDLDAISHCAKSIYLLCRRTKNRHTSAYHI